MFARYACGLQHDRYITAHLMDPSEANTNKPCFSKQFPEICRLDENSSENN